MFSSRLDSYLSSLISSLYLALLFFLPLLFSMKSSEVFEFPKMLFVYAMTVLIVACWITRMIVSKRIIYARTPLDIPIYFFLLSQLFSTFFSIDVHTSVFGFYSRWNGGLLSTIAYALLYSAFVSNARSTTGITSTTSIKGKSVHRADLPDDAFGTRGTFSTSGTFIAAILFSATLVSVYAILQRLGIDRNLWIQDVVSRVFSTQGQPNWLAAYLVMVMPFAWTSIVNRKQKTKYRILLLTAYCLLLTVLFFTRSRSGLLGFAIADVTFWIILFLKRSDLGVRQGQTFRGSDLWRPLFVVHCFLFIVFLLTNNPAREWIVRSVKREASSSSSPSAISYSLSPGFITPSTDIRKIVWKGAVELIKQRPLFGWGPETFAYTYWRVRPIEHNATSEWNFLYNKAHNEWLNLAANTGLFGLGTHLLLVIWFAWWSILTISRITNHESRITIAAILAAILGVESVNFFGFSTVTTQAYGYLFMTMAVAEGRRQKEEDRRESDVRIAKNGLRVARNELRIPFTVYCLLFTVFLVSLYLLSQISIWFLADLSYNRGKQYAKSGYLPEALEATQNAVDAVPNEPVFRSELAETQGVLAVSLAAAASSDTPDSPAPPTTFTTLTSLKDSSLTNFAIVERQSAANISFLRTRARVTYALGSLDPSLYEQGLTLMQRAMELAPTDSKIPYNLGVMLRELDRRDDATKLFQKALELKPDYDEARQALSSTNLSH